MTRRTMVGALVLVALGAAACGSAGSSTTTSTKATAAAGSMALVTTRATTLGKTLADSQGFTLYRLSTDGVDKSRCTGGCAVAWPPLLATSTPSFGDMSGFSTFSRGGGKTQVAYHGEPLYTFSGDAKPGDTAGQGLTDSWGHWTAVVFSASSSGSSTTTSSSSAGGYG